VDNGNYNTTHQKSKISTKGKKNGGLSPEIQSRKEQKSYRIKLSGRKECQTELTGKRTTRDPLAKPTKKELQKAWYSRMG